MKYKLGSVINIFKVSEYAMRRSLVESRKESEELNKEIDVLLLKLHELSTKQRVLLDRQVAIETALITIGGDYD